LPLVLCACGEDWKNPGRDIEGGVRPRRPVAHRLRLHEGCTRPCQSVALLEPLWRHGGQRGQRCASAPMAASPQCAPSAPAPRRSTFAWPGRWA